MVNLLFHVHRAQIAVGVIMGASTQPNGRHDKALNQ
jgi:hypothetical protein